MISLQGGFNRNSLFFIDFSYLGGYFRNIYILPILILLIQW